MYSNFEVDLKGVFVEKNEFISFFLKGIESNSQTLFSNTNIFAT